MYELCRRQPDHRNVPAVIAKVWLIGRSYAAAIERRREKKAENDDFYVNTVAPTIIRSGIDRWIESTAKYTSPDAQSLPAILATHAQVTMLFNEISGSRSVPWPQNTFIFTDPTCSTFTIRELLEQCGSCLRSLGEPARAAVAMIMSTASLRRSVCVFGTTSRISLMLLLALAKLTIYCWRSI